MGICEILKKLCTIEFEGRGEITETTFLNGWLGDMLATPTWRANFAYSSALGKWGRFWFQHTCLHWVTNSTETVILSSSFTTNPTSPAYTAYLLWTMLRFPRVEEMHASEANVPWVPWKEYDDNQWLKLGLWKMSVWIRKSVNYARLHNIYQNRDR